MMTKKIGLWAFFVGMALALATVFIALGDWAFQVLILLGFLAGFFHQHLRENLITLGITYLVLAAVAGSMGDLLYIGPYISEIAAAWVRFLGPVVLTAFMVWGSASLMAKKQS